MLFPVDQYLVYSDAGIEIMGYKYASIARLLGFHGTRNKRAAAGWP